MSAIVGRQVDAAGFVIGRHDDASAVHYVMLAQMLLVDAQHVRRGGGEGLHVLIKAVAICVAKVTRLTHAQHDRFQEPIEAPSTWAGEASAKLCGPIAYFTGSNIVSLPIPWLPPRTSA